MEKTGLKISEEKREYLKLAKDKLGIQERNMANQNSAKFNEVSEILSARCQRVGSNRRMGEKCTENIQTNLEDIGLNIKSLFYETDKTIKIIYT